MVPARKVRMALLRLTSSLSVGRTPKLACAVARELRRSRRVMVWTLEPAVLEDSGQAARARKRRVPGVLAAMPARRQKASSERALTGDGGGRRDRAEGSQ